MWLSKKLLRHYIKNVEKSKKSIDLLNFIWYINMAVNKKDGIKKIDNISISLTVYEICQKEKKF